MAHWDRGAGLKFWGKYPWRPNSVTGVSHCFPLSFRQTGLNDVKTSPFRSAQLASYLQLIPIIEEAGEHFSIVIKNLGFYLVRDIIASNKQSREP
jgi:hypothetical protein